MTAGFPPLPPRGAGAGDVHVCDAATYRVRYDFAAGRVAGGVAGAGPRKDYAMVSSYRRAADLA